MKDAIRARTLVGIPLFLIGLTSLVPSLAHAVPELELYGTFHAMGVVVTINGADDPDGNAVTEVEYRIHGDTDYAPGLPLSRIAETRFVGSLFWLDPGTDYDVRVAFSDPGGVLDGQVVELSAATRAGISIPLPEQSYYVSPGGSGTECSEAAPCPLAYGLGQAQAGDEVVLRGGVYYEGEFLLPRSGTEDAPIVLRSYPGETAVLDAADPEIFPWTDHGGGVYRTTVNAPGPHVVLADGERLFPYDSLSDLQALVWDNTPGLFADGATLYVHLSGDADPNDAEMTISRYNHAFRISQNFIAIMDLTFRHYGQGSWAKAIYVRDGSDNLIRGCRFSSNDLGVGIKLDSHRNVIEHNEFYDTIFGWPWDGVKDVGGLEDGGVCFYDPTTGRGNVIRRNIFHDDFDGFGVCPSSAAGVTNETDVYENIVYNMGDDGVETDGQCSNVRIWGNTFHDVLMGISLAPVYDGPVYAVRNLVYATGVGNNDYTGSPFKFNSGYAQSGSIFLFHNTADAALPGNNGLYIKAPGSWDMITARNNIWAGTTYAVHNYNTGQPIDLDFDDLWNGDAGNLVRWDGTNYATLEEFTAATGQESNGLSVEPGFADAGSGDYSLDAASDLIDEGMIIPGINDDYSGGGPDVGAFECDSVGSVISNDRQPSAAEVSLEVIPNPFHRGARIDYWLAGPAWVDVAVYDASGRRLRTLRAGPEVGGQHAVSWNGRDSRGRAVGNGAYFVRLRAGARSGSVRSVRVE